jgi:predicted metal-dependent peptidase
MAKAAVVQVQNQTLAVMAEEPDATPVVKKLQSGSIFSTTVQSGIARDCRVRAALSTIIEKSPGMAALALWVGHINGKTDEINGIKTPAWTNSKVICYNPSFSKISARGQVGVAAHEIMHVALRHPHRAYKMWLSIPNFNFALANIAADCIINDGLRRQSWLELPIIKIDTPEGPTDGHPWILSEVLEKYKKWAEETKRHVPNFPPLSAWAVEDVYHMLVRWRDESKGDLCKALGLTPGQLDAIEGMMDMQVPPQPEGESRETRNRREDEETREWRNRLIRAQAGDKPGGILRELAGDLPRVDTPWEKILQTQILQATQPKSIVNPTRPSRHWLSVSRAGRVRNVPYEPGIQFNPPGARIVLVADSSGSMMSQEILLRIAAEMESIAKRTKAELHVIVCDAEVTEPVVKIATGGVFDVLKKIKFTGGGGTDFRPAFKEAAKVDPAIIVYLTDMCGTFPERAPRCKTVWACTVMGQQEPPDAPFGVVVALR